MFLAYRTGPATEPLQAHQWLSAPNQTKNQRTTNAAVVGALVRACAIARGQKEQGVTMTEVGGTEVPAESYEGARGRPEKTCHQCFQIRLVTPPQVMTVLLIHLWLSNNLLDPGNSAKVCFSLQKQWTCGA